MDPNDQRPSSSADVAASAVTELRLEAAKACVRNGKHLLEVARSVIAASPRIAFHLATLALEETGKASLLAISGTSAALGREEPSIVTTALDDHVRKLFWALWGPSIQSERVTVAQIESLRGMARHIHETRLRGLYVDVSSDGVIAPEAAVAPADAELLVGMAAARLDLEPDHQLPTDPNRRDLQLWFIRTTEDPERPCSRPTSRSTSRIVPAGDSSICRTRAAIAGHMIRSKPFRSFT
jgi:AbiV family abortive infection protein